MRTTAFTPIRRTLSFLGLSLACLLIFSNGYAGLFQGARRNLPNFRNIRPYTKRREAFIGFLDPLAEQTNNHILQIRQKIIGLFSQNTLTSSQKAWLQKIAKHYDLDNWQVKNSPSRQQLLSRVDVIPPKLLLAQAANESAWGTSRFARQGNNLFGQWCYTSGCGLVPRQRPAGQTYEVKKFDSVAASIRAYTHNLNTNPAYRQFRAIRAQRRTADKPLTAMVLANGLSSYSQEGEAYVKKIQWMISNYKLGNA